MLRKTLGIVTTCLIAIYMASQPHNSCNQKNSHSQNKAPFVACAYRQKRSTDAPQHTYQYTPHWYTPVERPQWWLVVLTGVTAIAIWRQAVETKRAAQAGQESIRVVAGENRPWLLVESDRSGDGVDMPLRGSNPKEIPSCRFYIKNYGKTPARLLLVKADMVLGDSSEMPPNIEISEKGKRFNPEILPQGGSLYQKAELSIGTVGEFMEATHTNPPHGKHVWFRGVLEYEHTIKAEGASNYRTEFCYVWIVGPDYWKLIRSIAE